MHKLVDVDYQNKLRILLGTIKCFWNNILNKDYRESYNYIKHQGAFNILGINIPDFFKVEGIKPNIDIIRSKEIDINKMTNMLIDFNNKLIIYIDKIISIVIDPTNVKDQYHLDEINGRIINSAKKL